MSFLSKFIRLIFGFCIIFLILSGGLGSVQRAGGLLFVSIVCTAGIGLLLWFPLSYMVGTLAFKILKIDQNKKVSIELTKKITNNTQAIVNFIIHAQQSGYSGSEIERVLKENGWSDSDIKDAFLSIKR